MAIPNSRNFANCYMELCRQQRLRPLPVICVTLPHCLDFTTDRVKMDDWSPILNSLSLDRSLRSISVRSRYQCRKPLEEINSEDKARTMGKAPVVLSRYLLEWLSHSVSQCVRNSPTLTSLELEGIPFPPDCLAVLCVGLSHTNTLRSLSLQRCYIGDSSCELLCRTVADVPSVRSLNLSYCDLTCKCGPALASALSRQKLLLYHDTWKQSLRYQEPNLEAMPGLRRLTLNDNPQLGDAAIIELIEAIRDSLWLKAIDLQRCGLSDKIGKDLLELLDHNTTLNILDVRQNANLNERLVKEIIKRLEENSSDTKVEYRWLALPQQDRKAASAGNRKRSENENSRKPFIRPRSAAMEYGKSPYQAPSRKVISSIDNVKKTKMRPNLPPFKHAAAQKRQQQQQQVVQNGQAKSKITLHLDLQSYIKPAMDDTMKNEEDVQTVEENVQPDSDSSSKIVNPTKVDAATQMPRSLESEIDSARLEKIQVQLMEAKSEHYRLLEDLKQSTSLLTEERKRREVAEEELQTMKNNLMELENALREKEKETNGFLLLSQQSLDEICNSFDRLLEMVDSVTKNPNVSRRETAEAAIVKADIKRRVASVIRQTKSENLRRGFAVDIEDDLNGYTEPVRKFAKSESDMRNSVAPISALQIEKNIGDTLDVRSPILDSVLYRDKEMLSPRARARALFAQIVQGDTVFEFCTHVD
nr:PREDICTED: centrosomal protein of 78 kDa [Megachile rotundata]